MRISITLIFLGFLLSNLNAQSVWHKIEKSSIENFKRGDRIVTPTAYQAFTLDMTSLKKDLKGVSERDFTKSSRNKDFIEVPFPNGKMVTFEVWYAPVMAPNLAARYPSIRSYKGVSEDGKHVMRFLVSNAGFNGVISSEEGTIYLDPIYPENPEVYQSYYIKDQEDPDPYWNTCGTEDVGAEIEATQEFVTRSVSAAIPLRTYRMAIACTGEYGQIVGGTVERVLEQFNLAATRLSQIYELNASLTFQLIEETEQLIHLDAATDPYFFADQGRELIGENPAAVNNIIGSDAYDIGHVFTRNCTDGVAGIAALGSVCTNRKAAGVSCVGNANITSFASNTIAHEIGHQFNASHSWNNCPGSEENISVGWAYEPGSGTTIMSYSGLCGSSNTGISTEYFSAGSLDQIINYSRVIIADCGIQSTELNNEPVIDMPYENGFFIPKSTPFELDASATDEDGDQLLYAWDQYDLGPTSPLGSPQGDAPIFIPVEPDDETNRFFPRLNWVRGNVSNNVEVMPTYARNLTFRFVVKDQNPLGTAAVWEQVEFAVADNAGPFFVTQPNFNPGDAVVGDEMEVLWDVSNTDIEPVNCQFVNILLSTNDGLTFDHVLATNTPNDGSQVVRIPNATSFEARIKVEAVGNVFYDMSNSSFLIREPAESTYTYDVSNNYFDACAPIIESLEIQSAAFNGYSEPVEFSILSGLPDGTTANFAETSISPDGTNTLSFDISSATNTGEYEVILQSISASDTITQAITLNVTSTLFDDLAMNFPANGSSGNEQLPTFEWTDARNADRYIFELSTSPAFGETSIIYDENVTSNIYVPTVTLEKSTLYYWRVTPFNKCGFGESLRMNTFGTEALSCATLVSEDLPKNISPGAPSDIFSEIFVPGDGQVSAVVVENIKGKHQKLSNLTFTLESPSGTRAVLVSNECLSAQDFDCGFDDASPTAINCPFSQTYKPEEPLEIFDGEEISGNWRLIINDATTGNGGTFEEFDLQLCSNATLNAPLLIRNETLVVLPGSAAHITNERLEAEDADNGPEELIFTVVDVPTSGYLELSGNPIEVGSQFTQQNLNNAFSLKYYNTDDTAEMDQFTFTCIDGQGGWIDITTFNIELDESGISSNDDLVDVLEINVVPNPTKDLSIVNIKNTYGKDYKFQLVNLNGQSFLQQTLRGDQDIEINAKEFPAGVYMINIESEGFYTNKKLVILK